MRGGDAHVAPVPGRELSSERALALAILEPEHLCQRDAPADDRPKTGGFAEPCPRWPRRLPQTVFAVSDRIVYAPFLNLRVVRFTGLNEFVRRLSPCLAQRVQPVPDSVRVPVGKTFAAAGRSIQTLHLGVLVAGNVIAAREVGMLARMFENAVQSVAQPVVVLGLNIRPVHAIVSWSEPPRALERRRWRAPEQEVRRSADSDVDLLRYFAVFGGVAAEYVVRRAYEVADGLHFAQRVGEGVRPAGGVHRRPGRRRLRGDMRRSDVRRPFYDGPTHGMTFLFSSAPSDQAPLMSAPSRCFCF